MVVFLPKLDLLTIEPSNHRIALVNPVNCVGVMGKGLALGFKQHFPDNFNAYKQACQAGKVRPGQLFNFSEGNVVIVNFPTKVHWRDPSRYEWIEQGLEALAAELPRLNVAAIAIPKIGTGLGGLSWPKVRDLIVKHLDRPELSSIRIGVAGA